MKPSVASILNIPTPTQDISSELSLRHGCQLFIKRDDLIHDHICGNKWRKLKFNLVKAQNQECAGLLSFGGCYSNHLLALAAIGEHLNIPTAGIVRSYKTDITNPTISALGKYKMKIEWAHPSDYRVKEESPGIKSILAKFQNYFIIPVGGTNIHAISGIREMMDEIELDQRTYSHVIVTLGTGGTFAGIIKSIQNPVMKVIGISPFKGPVSHLKGFDLLTSEELKSHVIMSSVPETRFGAYDARIVQYIRSFYKENAIVLDPVYTAKAMMTTEHLINQKFFPRGSRILFIHTGGLQGISGFEYQYKCDLLGQQV